MTPQSTHSEVTIGYCYAFAALVFWGLMPVYWASLKMLPALLVVGHRTIWAAVILSIFIVLSGKWALLIHALKQKKILAALAVATSLLGFNWFIFVQAIANNKVMETSLGYYINPLLTITLGVVVFKERLRTRQALAVSLAAIAVIYQIIALGVVPYYALGLAATFSVYSVVKKTVRLDGLMSLAIESLLLAPLMFIYLFIYSGHAFFGGTDIKHIALLIGAGLATVLPLIWFSNAARRLPLTTLGFLNFLAPTISLVLAIFYFHEPFKTTHAVTFCLIGVALVFYATDLIQNSRAARHRGVS